MKYVHKDIRNKSDKPYYFVLRYNKKIYCRRGFENEEDAFIAAVAFIRQPNENNDSLKLNEVINSWLDFLKTRLVSDTIYSYKKMIFNWIYPSIDKNSSYLRISSGMMDSWYFKINKEKKLCTKSKNKLLTIFKSIYNYSDVYLNLTNKNLIRFSPFKDCNTDPFFENKDNDNFFTIPEFQKLLESVEGDCLYHLLFTLAFCGAMRIGELRGLAVDHIKENIICLAEQAQGKGTGAVEIRHLKTSSSKRLIFIPVRVQDELEAFIKSRKLVGESILFKSVKLSVNNSPLSENTINRHLKKYLKLCSLNSDLTFHAFRRSLATYLDQQGVRKKIIQSWLGHTAKDVTDKSYLKYGDEEIRKVVEMIDAALGSKK